MLNQVIQQFSHQEYRDFKFFLNKSKKGISKESVLLTAIRKEKEDDFIKKSQQQQQQQQQQPGGHYELRNRLKKQLESYILLTQANSDPKYSILKQLCVANYIYKLRMEKESLKYFKSTIKNAEQHELYSYFPLITEDYFPKMVSSKSAQFLILKDTFLSFIEKANNRQQTLLLLTEIRNTITQYFIEGKHHEIENKVEKILESYHFKDSSELLNVKYESSIIVYRQAILKGKFEDAAIHLQEMHKHLTKEHFFKKYPIKELYFYFSRCILAYEQRLTSKTFELAQQYYKAIKKVKSPDVAIHEINFYPSIQFQLLHNTNHNTDAIILLESIIDKYQLKSNQNQHYRDIIFINLSISYFAEKKYQQALKTILIVARPSPRFMTTLGKEGLIMKEFLEYLIRMELGQWDYVLSRLLSMKRRFKSVFQNYRYYNDLISFWVKMCREPKIVDDLKFKQKISAFLLEKHPTIRSSENLNFDSWFIAKINHRDYYEVYLEMLNNLSSL